MLIFVVSMNLRLIYIKEEDLEQQLIDTLKQISFGEVRVLFFVELKEVDEKAVPMIADLLKLRVFKAEKRITEWIENHSSHIDNFEVLAFDGHPTRSNPSYKLSIMGDQKIDVLLNPEYKTRIAPYLKYHAGAHQVKYLSLGDFSEENLNG
jgi:hypothetical protein